ncbi:MAG: hypothetical protein MUC50_16315 [Myxococcota bacterium]|jgi:hypothetical protein|nr:hypothetical protein [Myxococcota bacterium]
MKKNLIRTFVFWLLSSSLLACGSKDSSPGFTGSDSSQDTGSASDTVSDSSADTLSDSQTQSETSSYVDTTGWEDCPEASDYVGDPTWQHSLKVTAKATYCATFNEARTLEEELALKAQLRIVPGSYPLPQADGAYAFALPICVRFAPDLAAPTMNGAGELSATSSVYGEETNYIKSFAQPLDGAGNAWSLEGTIAFDSPKDEQPPPFVLDGGVDATLGDGDTFSFSLCRGAECYQIDDYTFVSCNPSTYRLQRHTVSFSGGQAVLDLRLGWSMASTEPGAFVRASGVLDGTSFEQEDYFRLVYNPEHHHFSRDFAVLFDSPIGTACGLRLEYLDPWGDELPTEVHTIACDLANLSARAVTNETFEEVDPGSPGF